MIESPFTTSTTYALWFKRPGKDWQKWSVDYQYQHLADETRRDCGKRYPEAELCVVRATTVNEMLGASRLGGEAGKEKP